MNITGRSADIFKYILYSIQGFILVAFNFVIVACILRHQQLRSKKTYIIMAGLALGDVLNGLGFMTAGPYRIRLILIGQDSRPTSAWGCMCTLHNAFWMLGTPLSSLLLICINLDRLIAVSSPLFYYGLTQSYARKLVASFYFPVGCMALVGVAVSYSQERMPKYPAVCFVDFAIGNQLYQSYFWLTQMVGATGSVLIYVLVYVLIKRKTNTADVGDDERKRQEQVEHRLMVTVGLSTLCSFVFVVLPSFCRIAQVWFGLSGALYRIVMPYSSIITNCNSMCNFFLYALRHCDLRNAFKSFLKCQPIAPLASSSRPLATNTAQPGPSARKPLAARPARPVQTKF